MHCRELAAQLRPRIGELAEKANVAFIGVGAPYMAQGFDEEFHISAAGAKVLTDPSRRTFDAAGMKRGVWRTLAPRNWPASLRTLLRGNVQKGTRGDPWQQGGALVVKAGGEIAYRHVDERPADQVNFDALSRALANA